PTGAGTFSPQMRVSADNRVLAVRTARGKPSAPLSSFILVDLTNGQKTVISADTGHFSGAALLHDGRMAIGVIGDDEDTRIRFYNGATIESEIPIGKARQLYMTS